MPIDFPNNPISGQTYSYAAQQWEYNGVAWDKIVIADDALKLVGVSGDYYAWNLPTGILVGGGITAAIGGSTFTVYAGEGTIMGLTGDDPIDFTQTKVKWSNFTGVTLTYLASSQSTYLYIDSAGNLQQQTTDFSDEQWKNSIILGTICHIDNASINLVTNEQNAAYDIPHKLDEFIECFGPIKRSGLRVYGYTAGSLQLARTGGTIFKTGSNYINDQFEPDVLPLGAVVPSMSCRVYGNNTVGFTFDTNGGSFYTNIDPTKYNNNGVLSTVNNNEWSIQRLFLFGSNPNDIICYYGPAKYNSFATARDGYESEVFEEAEITAQNAVYLGNLFVRGGAADLTSTGDAFFVQAGFARGVAGGGGGGGIAVSLNDLTNVNITGVTTGQVLYYDGSGFWVNQNVSFFGVTGATGATGSQGPQGNTGATGPVDSYVRTLNGLSGDITFTNGNGLIFSNSGNNVKYDMYVHHQPTTADRQYLLWSAGVTNGEIVQLRTSQNVFIVPNTRTLGTIGDFVLSGATTSGTNANTVTLKGNGSSGIELKSGNSKVLLDSSVAGFGFTTGVDFKTNDGFSDYVASLGPAAALSADRSISIPDDSGTIALTKNVVSSFNGSTGAVVGVSSVRGLTGAVGITNGSGIGLSVSGQTMTFSNTGVLSIDGGTGAITNVARTNVANSFTESQSISGVGKVLSIDDLANIFTAYTTQLEWYNDLSSTSQYWVPSPGPNPSTITFPNETGTIALTKNVVSSFNGSTGSISGVNSIRGLTGIVGLTNGSGISLGVSGKTLTISNTGVLSINGGTGAITNVARTNVDNYFSASQTISTANASLTIVDSSSLNEVSFQGEFNRLYFYNDLSGGEVFLQPTIAPASTITVSLPDYTTTLAGLAGTQTFTGTNTFNTLTNFPGGISAAGATFSGDVAVNGGDITTTSTLASLFNANATTLNILNTQSSGFTLNIGSATSYSGTKNINIGGNVGGGAQENVRIGSASSASKISILGGITLGAVGGTNVRVAYPSEFVVESTSTVNGTATFNGQARFNAGISAAGGITFNSNVTVNTSNILNAGSIQTDKASMEIDTARAASRVAIGDINGLGNGNHIYIRNATSELNLVNSFGTVAIGDLNALSTGNYIYYYADENRLSSATNSDITEFGNIYANNAFYETANQIRVTNNARSWFL